MFRENFIQHSAGTHFLDKFIPHSGFCGVSNAKQQRLHLMSPLLPIWRKSFRNFLARHRSAGKQLESGGGSAWDNIHLFSQGRLKKETN